MQDLETRLEQNLDQYLQHLKNLVAIDTQCIGHGIDGGKEKAGQEYIAQLMAEIGADEIIRDPLNEDTVCEAIRLHDEGNKGHVYDQRYNVYASFTGTNSDQARSILFNGHMDTMPPGIIEHWTNNPWEPTVRKGKLYGLGAADMKSGLLAPLLAIDLIKSAGQSIAGDVKIISVADEEGGGNGSIVAAMNGITADAAVVCEPTNDELIVAHMGFVFFNIKTSGLAIHAGDKFKGVSAIEKAIKVIAGLYELEHTWLGSYKHQLLPPPSINVGVIEGGSAGSTVSDSCTVKICVHYLPGIMSRDLVETEIMEAIKRVEAGDEWLAEHPVGVEIYQAGGAFEMDIEHQFTNCFRQAYTQALDRPVKCVGSPSGCDARIWRNLAGLPTLQFGPGALEQCHAVDEFVSIELFKESILVYAKLILAWCTEK